MKYEYDIPVLFVYILAFFCFSYLDLRISCKLQKAGCYGNCSPPNIHKVPDHSDIQARAVHNEIAKETCRGLEPSVGGD